MSIRKIELNLYLDSIDFNTKSPKIGNNQDEKLISSQLALALSGKHYTEASYHQHIKPNRFGLKQITILVIHNN